MTLAIGFQSIEPRQRVWYKGTRIDDGTRNIQSVPGTGSQIATFTVLDVEGCQPQGYGDRRR